MNIENIAMRLKEMGDYITLIFAFNSLGKTRLSVVYKDITKDPNTGKHAGVYYNAFTEDLFVWDNDEENNGAEIKLKILSSSLNQFHTFLYGEENPVFQKLIPYNPKFSFRLNPHKDLELGIESVTFFENDSEEVPIKISRSEERIFVWCFHLALLERTGWVDEKDAHIFIDDPISSLDEHNIYITADMLFDLFGQHHKKKRIIITTHHVGLFSILADRLKKGEKADRYKEISKLLILGEKDGEPFLYDHNKNVFLYHLYVLQILEEASKGDFLAYHVSLLRQALESISSFLGVGRISYTLEQIDIENANNVANMIHSLAHKDAYINQSMLVQPAFQDTCKNIVARLLEKYKFELH